MYKDLFFQKLGNQTACIGIVGLGYVGLPLLLRFAEAGFPVLGFDIDPQKVDKLNNGESYIGSSGLIMADYPGHNLKSLLHKAFSAKVRFWTPFSGQKLVSTVVQGFQVFWTFSPA
jgi:hypothetical protein